MFSLHSEFLSSALLCCTYNSQYPKIHRSNTTWRFQSWERSGEEAQWCWGKSCIQWQCDLLAI